MCDRMDSPFWVDNSKTEIPEKLLNLLDTNFDVKIKSRDELYEAVSGISQTSIPFALQHYLLINKGNRSKYKKGII
jgi:hypothetical protein